jgi:hypothetical protein
MTVLTDADQYLRGAATVLATWGEDVRGATDAARSTPRTFPPRSFPNESERALRHAALLERELAAAERADAMPATTYVIVALLLEAWWPGGSDQSGGARELLELVARLAVGDLPEVDEHDRASRAQLVYRVRDGVVAERGLAEEPPDAAEAGDSRALGVVVVGDDYDAVVVRERALALLVGIAGEAAGAVVAPNDAAAKCPDRGVVPERSRVPANGLLANVAERSAGQQPEVVCGRAGGAKRRDRAARRGLGGEGLAKCGH